MAGITKTQIRIPTGLIDWVKERGVVANRSMNAELITILEDYKKIKDRERKEKAA